MNSSFFTVGPTGSPHETRIVWSFCSNYDFATQPMEIGQVGPVLRHCLRHSRGDNRVGFPGSEGARLAAMIGGVPLAIIGSLALGWYGFLFGSVNRLRFGEMLGLVLGLLVGGLVGSVCGLIVLTLPWSLVGALIGGILGSNLTAQAPTFPQTLLWDCPGNLWRDSRPGFPKGPRPRSGRGNQWLAHRRICGDRGLVGPDRCAESDVEDTHGMGPVA